MLSGRVFYRMSRDLSEEHKKIYVLIPQLKQDILL
jgi:hypothetical protein